MSNTLTVVVVDTKNHPVPNANVSISPSDVTMKTNASGEAVFTLGNAKKYDITATADSKVVTVPYYVTENGATRLVVNPVYVKSIEDQLHPSIFSSIGPLYISGFVVTAFIAIFLLWKLFRRGR